MRRVSVWGVPAVVFAVIVISRCPDVLLHPQFYAEDGQAWFADAHNLPPLQALFLPLAGYYEFFQRFVAFALTPLSLTSTPLAYALVAITVQLLPAVLFASPRLRNVIADDRARWVLAGVYLLIPNVELTGNLTNTQWHLALLAFVLLLATPPRSSAGRAAEAVALVFAGLSGPYAFFLVPLGVLMHRHTLVGWRRIQLSILGAAGLIELGIMAAALHGATRAHGALGASLPDLVLILCNQLLSHLGRWGFSPAQVVPAALAAALFLLLLVAGFKRGPSALRYFIVFAVAVMATGLLTPYGRLLDNRPAWDLMATGSIDNRYFFMYAVAVVLSGIAVGVRLRGRTRAFAFVGAAALFLMLPAALGQWQYPAAASEHLDHYQMVLERAPAGTTVTIPIVPKKWTMELIAGR